MIARFERLRKSVARSLFLCAGVLLIVGGCKDVQVITISNGNFVLSKYDWWGLLRSNVVLNMASITEIKANVAAEPTDIYPGVYDLHLTLKDRTMLIPNWRGKKKILSVVDSVKKRCNHLFINAPFSFLSWFGLLICFLAYCADDKSAERYSQKMRICAKGWFTTLDDT